MLVCVNANTRTIEELRRLWPEWNEVDPETGCWNWTRSTVTGYGVCRAAVLGRGGNILHAHVVAYAIFRGQVSSGMQEPVHHNCGNRRCTNPDHLEILTTAEHARFHWGPIAPNVEAERARQRRAARTAEQIERDRARAAVRQQNWRIRHGM